MIAVLVRFRAGRHLFEHFCSRPDGSDGFRHEISVALQSVNGILNPISTTFGVFWVWLDSRQVNPSIPVRPDSAYLVWLPASCFGLGSGDATRTILSWLVVTYFLHTVGELYISPIGLSAITKLSPARRGQMMGIWFVGAHSGTFSQDW